MTDLWPPLWLSLRIALTATVLVAMIGIPLARWMSRVRFFGKGVLETIILLPLVLPPTVVGYLLLIATGHGSPVGRWLTETLGVRFVFEFQGAVLAAAVVALPMIYIPTKAAFASIEPELDDVARLMGANRLQTFFYVTLPLARRGIYSGLVLAFARAIGEFGATMMVFGWQEGRETLPISIYLDYTNDQYLHAASAVIALTIFSGILVYFYNRSTGAGRF